MTAVASFQVQGHPVIVGDLLITGNNAPGSPKFFPTTLFEPYKSSSTKSPTKLHQKISVIGGNIAIGWAGDYSIAQDLIGELVLRSQQDTLDFEFLVEYLGRQGEEVWTENGVIGYIMESAGKCRGFGWGRRRHAERTQSYGYVSLLGSGESDLATFFDTNPNPMMELDGGANRCWVAAAVSLSLSSTFLAQEIRNFESLKSFYGGGYEVIVADGDRFVKLDDLQYVFWYARFERGNRLMYHKSPFSVMQLEYVEDLLIVRTLGFSRSGENHADLIFTVPPVHRHARREEKATNFLPTLTAGMQCNVIFVEIPGQRPGVLTIVSSRPEDSMYVQFKECEGDVTGIDVSGRFYELLTRSLSERFPGCSVWPLEVAN